jgi:hypothetical protein
MCKSFWRNVLPGIILTPAAKFRREPRTVTPV